MGPDPMKIPMLWFIPLAIGVGVAGTRTALQLRKVRGRERRNEIVALILIAWVPMLAWALAALRGTAE